MSNPSSNPDNKNWAAPFFTIWTGQAFSLFGSRLVQFALIWWLTKTTGSATVLATASLAGLLPQVVLGPLTGALVDRWNRRIVMIVADSIIALATVALALLFLTETVQIWQVYLLMFIRATAGGFHWPAMTASTSLMVPKENLSRIQGFNQMLQGGMSIIAAPLGALLLEVLPIQGVLVIDVGTALLAIAPLFFIAIPQPDRQLGPADSTEKPSIWQDMWAGLRYVWSWPGMMMIAGMALVINFLLTPAGSLTPILVTKHFQGQAMELAWMQSASGVGMVLGGLLLGAWGGFKRRILTSLFGLIVLGIGMAMIGFVPSGAILLAIGLMFITGLTMPIVNGPIFAVMQATVPPDMQGRVFTLLGSASAAMAPLGLIIAGPVADKFGVQTWYIIGGIVTAAMGLIGFFMPAVVNVEDGPPAAVQLQDVSAPIATNPGD
ncbi:MAG: MFS transporter [Chloroflexota bacterium]|nr:MFS transporter [Chloroflexota bacterium]